MRTDTTQYIPVDWLRTYQKVTVQDDRLVRYSQPLAEGVRYMFVINKDDELIVARKEREGKYGRIHHTSLAQGKDVYLAGMIKVKDGQVILTNESGHYRPDPLDFEKFSSWIERQGKRVIKISDRTYDTGYSKPTREVALKILNT